MNCISFNYSRIVVISRDINRERGRYGQAFMGAHVVYAPAQRAVLIGRDCRPIDMLRFKLAFFGASKFDPRSDRWTRINLFQGAPTLVVEQIPQSGVVEHAVCHARCGAGPFQFVHQQRADLAEQSGQ